MQLTRISNSEVTLDVAALGAEMQTLTTRVGRRWLWRGGAHCWTGRSPSRCPVVGRAPQGTISLGDRRYQRGQRGCARRGAFTPVDEWREHCTYRLGASEPTLAMYPF